MLSIQTLLRITHNVSNRKKGVAKLNTSRLCIITFKGAGGSYVDFFFFIVSDKVIAIVILKNTYN